MDVVYRYRRSGTGDELRYSLRSLNNLPHDRVWIVGETQPWLTGVGHISVPQTKRSKWDNSRANIVAASNHPGVSADFILMDDDFLVVEPIDSVPVLHRGRLLDHRAQQSNPNRPYGTGMAETAELLRAHGVEDPLSYELHVPMVIRKDRMLECLAILDHARLPSCFHLRSWYANYWRLGGTQISDVKVRSGRDCIPTGPFLSTDDILFKSLTPVKKLLQAKFPTASPYEST